MKKSLPSFLLMIGLSLAAACGRYPNADPHGVEPDAHAGGGGGAQAVTVLDENRALLMDLPHGGFITVIQNGVQRARLTARVDQSLPVRIVEYANGRLTVVDDHTGWSAELGAFGSDNKAAFERLMSQ